MPHLRLQGIAKAFQGNPVVRNVDLSIESGEFLVMVGPSGCGKTTLLRLVAGLENPDRGDIYIRDQCVTHVPPRDRNIGMVFQSYALYPHMTVRQNLEFGLSLRAMPRQEVNERVASVARMLEIDHLIDVKPKALSGGQRQRVAIGRAIARRPSLFLFDEPLSNLDASLRVQMRGELARLHQQLKSTIVYVTHDQVEAMTLATRIAVFHQGVLQQLGPPLDLYHRPTNTFVATFLGSPSMSLLDAEISGTNVRGSGFHFRVPTPQVHQKVKVGLRSQHVKISSSGSIQGTITAIERLGADGFAYVNTAAGAMVAHFDQGLEAIVGANVTVAIHFDAAHIFSSDGTTALHHPTDSVG